MPARNTIFLSLALAWAEAAGARDLFIGVNALDYSGYPDCRPEFIAAFEAAGQPRDQGRASKGTVHGSTRRCIAMTKAEIVHEAARLGLDPALSWSCYDPQPTDGIAACAIPAGCAPRASPRRGSPIRPVTPQRRMSYAVKEIFLTLQGEGARRAAARCSCASPAAICGAGARRTGRRADCNFCDTDFVGTDGAGRRQLLTRPSLADRVAELCGPRRRPPRWSSSPAASRCCSSMRR